MRPGGVVLLLPHVEGGQAGERDGVIEQLPAQAAVEPLDFSGGGRRPRRGEPVLPGTQGEHDGVTHYEHLDTGVPGTLECGDARGVRRDAHADGAARGGERHVASVMWQAWLP